MEGLVVHTRARWTADQSTIVTDVTLELADGTRRTMVQRGGVVGTIGVLSKGMPVLQTGDRVALQARASRTLRGREALALQKVLRLERPISGENPSLLEPKYVRTQTETGQPLYWSSRCIFVTYDDEGTPAIEGDEEFAVLDRSFASWQRAADACSYLQIVLEGRRPQEIAIDEVNAVKFRNDRWCTPATADTPELCHDPDAMAITTVSYIQNPQSPRHGEIIDADIEINAVHYAVSVDDQTTSDRPCHADLTSVVTHEIGHVLGLADACTNTPSENDWLDAAGNPVPSCWQSGISPEVRASTMFGVANCGETFKATLEPQDEQALCEMYPAANDPGVCARASRTTVQPKEDSGCAVSAGALGSASWAGAAAMISLALGLRRRRRN